MKMSEKMVGLFLVFASLLVSACAASVSTAAAPSSDVDWRRAYVMGESRCDRNQSGATQDDYVACLEESQRIMNETKAAVPGSSQKNPATPTTASSPPQPVPQPTTPMLPLPGAGPVAPQPVPQPVPQQGTLVPVCDDSQEYILEVRNLTNYLIEPRSPYLQPQRDDAMSVLYAQLVRRHDGSVQPVAVVGPNTTAKFVFVLPNCGSGRVRVTFNAFRSGPVPAPQIGWMQDQVGGYAVPKKGGWYQEVEDFRLRKFN